MVVAICLLVVIQAIIWAPFSDPDSATRGVVQAMGALGGFGLVILVRNSPSRFQGLMWGLAMGALVMAIVALGEFVTGVHLPQVAGRPWIFGKALGATFTNPNNFAAHIPLMVTAMFAVGVRTPRLRLPFIIAIVILLLADVATYSRTAFFTLGLCFVGVIATSSGGKVSRIVPKLILAAGAAGLLLLVFGGLPSDYSEQVLSGSGRSNELRLELISQAGYMLVESFGVGIGPGRIEKVIHETDLGLAGVSDVHNSILEMAVAYGLIPAMLLVSIIAIAITRCFKRAERNPSTAALGFGAATSVALGAFVASSVLGDAAWWIALASAALAADHIAGGVNDKSI